MLERLDVRNIALIADAHLLFSPHLTVLSGETGAGKTALFSALRLLVGSRADSDMIRDSASSACIEGTFVSPDGTMQVLRRIDRSGRSRCAVDGTRVKVSELARLTAPLLELHAQHENQRLLRTESHVHYLDAWAGDEVADLRTAYEQAFDAWVEARRDFETLRHASMSSQQDREQARLFLADLEEVDPQPGEIDQLEAQLPLLEHADALASAADEAAGLLRRDGGVEDLCSEASLSLTRQEGVDPALDELSSRLSELSALAEDLGSDLRAYRDSIDFDPQRLTDCQERLARLDGLCKRHGPRMEDVFARADEARHMLELADSSSDALDEAAERLERADDALVHAASALAAARSTAAEGFTQTLTDAVARLAMGGSSFLVAASDLPREAWTREGSQHVELLYSPGVGVAPRPLAKIASGGELSRVMLALVSEVDLGEADTLVFDEVDAGIGGATANLVADRLVDLAQDHQVIVVTHLAQIAACADRHLLVSKREDETGKPSTVVRPLEGSERIIEIARMLSGTGDEVSLEHARALLDRAKEG